MTTPLNECATVQDLLFDDVSGEPVTALAVLMRERDTIAGRFPPALIDVASRELADATTGLISANLADIAAAGWKKYKALNKAALRTREDPTAKELVSLVTHRIVSSHHPTIDVYLDGRMIATVEIGLEVTLTISGVLAVVKQGRLTEIRSGSCIARGSVAVQGIAMITKQANFDLYGAFRLGNRGVPLLNAPASTDRVEPVVVGEADAPQLPAAWYPDPTRRYQSRWWDGSRWTHRVSTDGHVTSDPLNREPIRTR